MGIGCVVLHLVLPQAECQGQGAGQPLLPGLSHHSSIHSRGHQEAGTRGASAGELSKSLQRHNMSGPAIDSSGSREWNSVRASLYPCGGPHHRHRHVPLGRLCMRGLVGLLKLMSTWALLQLPGLQQWACCSSWLQTARAAVGGTSSAASTASCMRMLGAKVLLALLAKRGAQHDTPAAHASPAPVMLWPAAGPVPQ